MFSVEPPAFSRFANPYDPDFPPAPPDDPAAEFLSPVPQWPKLRLMVPLEGTGYLDMLEAFKRDRLAKPSKDEGDEGAEKTGTTPPPEDYPLPEPPTSSSPFGAAPEDRGESKPDSEMDLESEPNLGTFPGGLTPNRTNGPVSPETSPSNPATPPQTRRRSSSKDLGVLLAAFQKANIPPPAGFPVEEAIQAQTKPAKRDQTTTSAGYQEEASSLGEGTQRPEPDTTPGPRRPEPLGVPNDPFRQIEVPPDIDTGPGLAATPEGEKLERFLTAPIPFDFVDEVVAAGLPKSADPYMIGPREALEIALVNSRGYQFRLDSVMLAALPVTLQRFSFEPQFYAGLGNVTATAGGIPPGGGSNQFLYRTREAPGGQLSQLNLSTIAGFGKLFNSGLRLAGGFANTTIFQFTGATPRQPTVQSLLPITLTQPFLRGGGRAVVLEALTQAERNLLYEVRSFARFRQEFFVNILTSQGQGVTGAGIGDPSIGYLNLVRQLLQVENTRKNVVAFERVLEVQIGLAQGAGSNISSIDVDQVQSSLERQRVTLVNTQNTYRTALDSYKIQLGMPPDVPLVPDYTYMDGFKRVFRDIDKLSPKLRSEVQRLIDQLPPLEDIIIDGRSLIEAAKDNDKLEDLLLAAERVALENRLDLMNERAGLYDVWRQIRVAHNALQGVFNVTVTNQVFTSPTTTNPFGFLDQSKQFSLVLNGELPLIRVSERNNFRTSLINYERERRSLMAAEDTIKLQVRNQIRALVAQYLNYDVNKRNFLATLRAADNSLLQLFGPAQAVGGGGGGQGGTQTNLYTGAQSNILNAQNTLVNNWVDYQTSRLALYRDLGVLPYDEWEAFYELFPAATSSSGGPSGGRSRPAPPAEAPGGLGGAAEVPRP
jgi:hypothetical protein